MTFLSKYQTILLVLALLGIGSVFGAFFADHTMAESCLFNIATDCPIMLSAVDESIHHLNTFAQYFGGLTAALTLVSLVVIFSLAYLARDTLISLPIAVRQFLRSFETVNVYSRQDFLRWIALHNKVSSGPIVIGR